MSSAEDTERFHRQLESFFSRELCQKATRPLRTGVQILVYVDQRGPFCLEKTKSGMIINRLNPKKPDLTLRIPSKALEELCGVETSDLGEMGIAIMKLMIHPNPAFKIQTKVHVGIFGMVTSGYFGIIPLGGSTMMKFLAQKGFSNIGKIKEAIGRLRA